MRYTIEDVKKIREAFDKVDKFVDKHHVEIIGDHSEKYMGPYIMTADREWSLSSEKGIKLTSIVFSINGFKELGNALKNETDEKVLETLNKKRSEAGYNAAIIGAMNCMPLFEDYYNEFAERFNYNDKIVGFEDASLFNRFNNSVNEAEKLAGKSEISKGKDNKEDSFYKLIYKPLLKVQELGAVGAENMTAKESSEYEKSMRELKNCISTYKNNHNPWFGTGKKRLEFAKNLDKVLDVELEKMDEFSNARMENMATLDNSVANKELVGINSEVKEMEGFEVVSFKSLMQDMVKNDEVKAPMVNDKRIKQVNNELYKVQFCR